MLNLKTLLILAFTSHLGSSTQNILSDVDSKLGISCCNAIKSDLSSIVHFPSSPEYKSRNAQYYSGQQQGMLPACTVKPTDANDVSRILQIARSEKCPFAVASGGHMNWRGSSNINGGLLIDLRALNQIDISPAEQTVKLGPGSTWIKVYAAMEPYNVTMAGGRISPVGVGGFLLGGGIAFASVDKGLGSSSIFNYEVVLSNGSIISVNKDEHAHLFWAMHLPSTNFGIVTRFDVRTYPSPEIWGAVNAYPFTPTVVSDLCAQSEKWGHDETKRADMVAIMMLRNQGSSMMLSVQTNGDAIPQEPLTSTPSIMHLETIGSTHKVINEVVDSALAATTRARWFTITTKIDTDFFIDMFERSEQMMKHVDDVENLTWAITVQHFQRSFINQVKGTPVFNALGQGKDDLVNLFFRIEWSNPDDDSVLENLSYELGTSTENEARKRGLLNDFIYLNYADGRQPVYERSVAPNDMKRMIQIKKIYDAEGIFDELWRGGYKLPKEVDQKSRVDRETIEHTEL